MAIADTITSMQTHTTNAYTTLAYATDLTGINKNLANLKQCIFDSLINSMSDTLNPTWNNLPKITGTGTNISLNNTIEAPMRITLGASELTQAGTPTPSSPQDIHTISGSNTIKVNGKNLFDKSRDINTTYNSSIATALSNYLSTGKYATGYISNGTSISSNTRYVTTFTPIMSGVTYTIKNNGSSSANFSMICFIDINGNVISHNTAWSNQAYTHTATSEEKYVLCGIDINDNGTDYRDYVQIEVGSTATTYTPYISQEADIDLGGTQLYNYFDNALYNSSTTRVQTNDYISLPAGTYTISYSGANQVYAIYFDNSNTKVGETNWTTGSLTFTYNTAYKYKFVFRKTGDATINATEVKNVMLNKGSTALPYQEYIEPINYSKIGNYEDKFIRNSGRNKLQPMADLTASNNGINLTNDNGIYTLSGTTGGTASNITKSLNAEYTIQSGDYLYTGNDTTSSALSMALLYNGTQVIGPALSIANRVLDLSSYAGSKVNQIRFYTTANNSVNMVVKPMICNTSTLTDFEPYGTNEWYIKKNIGKIKASELIVPNNLAIAPQGVYLQSINANAFSTKQPVYCNVLINKQTTDSSWNAKDGKYIGQLYGNYANIYINKDFESSGQGLIDALNWLKSINFILYYILATPTYTKITGTLAEQLENVYQKLLSYDNTTNISQINNDLAFQLGVQAIEK